MDWLLFSSALISATLLPGGSEGLLILRLSEGADPFALVLAATAGNVLGSLITFGMGLLGRGFLRRLGRDPDAKNLARAERLFVRCGRPALLFAWLPFIGDPLCLVAGLLRTPVAVFLPLVTLGKMGRYAFLAWSIAPHLA